MSRSRRESKGSSQAKSRQSKVPRRVEARMAPPKYAERHHAKPGAGIKRSRANMAPKPR
jgi:hypothetical protein